jgi:hypothetical protein
MRKLILSLVFVLATGSTFMNATTISEDIDKDCIGFAFDLEGIVGEMDYETFSAVVGLCEAL